MAGNFKQLQSEIAEFLLVTIKNSEDQECAQKIASYTGRATATANNFALKGLPANAWPLAAPPWLLFAFCSLLSSSSSSPGPAVQGHLCSLAWPSSLSAPGAFQWNAGQEEAAAVSQGAFQETGACGRGCPLSGCLKARNVGVGVCET